eukprot:CAMPEP_0182431350 /NCGR_PEP_ID=MMETSP1167-20130531/48508_1 /TAXON_ID=2988 /ORGANISM="Mallomonas Sp, Strain CCMP3275" /LENGTH=585 /DNA_ID=CAMNT_0024617595 /DNA_START=82 /DNA_END=1836 /DNA_ORIENTATION=+
MEVPSNKQAAQEIREKLLESNVNDAYRILKKNPLVQLNLNDAKLFLNNLDNLDLDKEKKDPMEMTESANFIYKRLQRQKVLRGYGCVDGEYPEKALDISPTRLEELSGIKTSSLTPRQRPTYWRLAGISLCAAEYILGSALGIEPLYTLIPLTFASLIADQILLKGAVFETAYQTLFPEYKTKIIAHEAGHFLVAYLLGLSVRGCITNAWQAREYPEIQGQAGTMFFDQRLMDEVAKQKVTRSSLERLCVVIMAGIAAEALKFDKAEGGASDEQSLVTFFTSMQPPWNLLRIQGQARWGVLQALLLIKEHQMAYDALLDTLQTGGGVGDCVEAIEKNLPEVLPSDRRIREREERLKRIENDKMLRYIQRMTWRAGGVEAVNASTALFSEDGTGSLEGREGEPPEEELEILDVVSVFSEKIKKLEDAVRVGTVPPSNDSSGVWINGLQVKSKDSSSISTDLTTVSVPDKTPLPSSIELPEPLPDFEKRVQELRVNETAEIAGSSLVVVPDKVNPAIVPLIQAQSRAPTVTPKELLLSNRGYQLRQLENKELDYRRKVMKIDKRLIELKKEMLVRESEPSTSRSSRW